MRKWKKRFPWWLQERIRDTRGFSKNKTLLNQLVSGNEYANIWSDVSYVNRNSFTNCCFISGRRIEFSTVVLIFGSKWMVALTIVLILKSEHFIPTRCALYNTEWRHNITEPEWNLNHVSQIKYRNLETELNVMKKFK